MKKIITTAFSISIWPKSDDFSDIEQETRKWFNRPLKLIYNDENSWRVSSHESGIFDDYQYYVVRHGTGYRVELRDPGRDKMKEENNHDPQDHKH